MDHSPSAFTDTVHRLKKMERAQGGQMCIMAQLCGIRCTQIFFACLSSGYAYSICSYTHTHSTHARQTHTTRIQIDLNRFLFEITGIHRLRRRRAIPLWFHTWETWILGSNCSYEQYPLVETPRSDSRDLTGAGNAPTWASYQPG